MGEPPSVLLSTPPSPASLSAELLKEHLKQHEDTSEKYGNRTISEVIEGQPLNTLQVMLQQEARSYRSPCLQGLDLIVGNDQSRVLDWFRSMTQWCYEVVDCYELPLQSVDVAINLLDRFLFGNHCKMISSKQASSIRSSQPNTLMSMRREILNSCSRFQLATMTCLYIASKVFSPKCLTPTHFERLSRNKVAAWQIESMEKQILYDLQFRINCPTITSFAKYYVQEELRLWNFDNLTVDRSSIKSRDEDQQRSLFLHLVEQQARLATCKLYPFHVPVSSIALACVKNTLKAMETQLPSMKYTFMNNALFRRVWHKLENKVRSYYDNDQRDIALVQEQLQSRLRSITLQSMLEWKKVDQKDDSNIQPSGRVYSSTSSVSSAASKPSTTEEGIGDTFSSPKTVMSS